VHRPRLSVRLFVRLGHSNTSFPFLFSALARLELRASIFRGNVWAFGKIEPLGKKFFWALPQTFSKKCGLAGSVLEEMMMKKKKNKNGNLSSRRFF
jgi:hypothetical protein